MCLIRTKSSVPSSSSPASDDPEREQRSRVARLQRPCTGGQHRDAGLRDRRRPPAAPDQLVARQGPARRRRRGGGREDAPRQEHAPTAQRRPEGARAQADVQGEQHQPHPASGDLNQDQHGL